MNKLGRSLHTVSMVFHFSGMVKESRFKVIKKSAFKKEFSLRIILSKLCSTLRTKVQNIAPGVSGKDLCYYGPILFPKKPGEGNKRLLGETAYSSHQQ